MTEEEVMVVINNVANRLARRFKFGYHEMDDMKQQARLFAWEGMSKYDGKRPLENFLWTHVRNRLFNFKRDKYERPGKPCLDCKYLIYDNDGDRCKQVEDKTECTSYNHWIMSNERKKNLMNPTDLENIISDNEEGMKLYDDISNSIDCKKILEIIERELPVQHRMLFLRFKENAKLTKNQKENIRQIILNILNANGYNYDSN